MQEDNHESEPLPPEKMKGKLFGFLAFRVLLVSFVFIVVPLIFYSLIIYKRDYAQKLEEVFSELKWYEEDQTSYLNQMEVNYLNVIDSVHKLVELSAKIDPKANDKHVAMILSEFANKSHITGMFCLDVLENGDLVCTDSTQPLYQGLNFTPYINLDLLHKEYDNIFIAKDPVFGYSLYLTYKILDAKGVIDEVIVVAISLDQLVDQMASLRSVYETNISILSENYAVIASSEPTLLGEQFRLVSEDEADLMGETPEGGTLLERMNIVQNSYKFSLLGTKRFAVIAKVPHTNQYFFLSVPAKIVLFELYHYIWHLASLLVFIIVIGGAATYILTLRISKPLQQLGAVMTKVGEGDLSHHFHKDRMGFEINYLGEQFNQMITSLETHIEEAEKERAFKEAYAKEIQIGHDIQSSILPDKEISFPGMQTSVYFKPAKEVAGDFYDWMIQETSVIITIADGVGKGISSCLYSFDLRSMLRSFFSIEQDFSKAIISTNRLFCGDTKETGNFVTAFISKYHSNERRLEYANCGHNAPFLKRKDGTIERLRAKGIAFGVELFESVDLKEVILQKGDFLIFYTDGISEAQNESGELFGEDKLENVIRYSSADNPDLLTRDIIASVSLFTGEMDQYDDMTLIVSAINT